MLAGVRLEFKVGFKSGVFVFNIISSYICGQGKGLL